MRGAVKAVGYLLLTAYVMGCGTSSVVSSAKESYKLKPTSKIEDKLALFSMMAAGSSTFNSKSDSLRIAEAPYSQPRIVKGAKVNLPSASSMEGFRNTANDILIEKLKEKKNVNTIIPPKQVQSIINESDITSEYLEFLKNYSYLSANLVFLEKLGKLLDCRYLLVPQLVIISNVNDNSASFLWRFGKRTTNYTVVILAHVWDLSTGTLVWTGRGSSKTSVGLYEEPASFEALAAKSAEELIGLLP
jgi:hypothetical protein